MTTIHGTRKIVKKNIILDKIKYVAISALGKSIVESVFARFCSFLYVLFILLFVCVRMLDIMVLNFIRWK